MSNKFVGSVTGGRSGASGGEWDHDRRLVVRVDGVTVSICLLAVSGADDATDFESGKLIEMVGLDSRSARLVASYLEEAATSAESKLPKPPE